MTTVQVLRFHYSGVVCSCLLGIKSSNQLYVISIWVNMPVEIHSVCPEKHIVRNANAFVLPLFNVTLYKLSVG